MRKEHRYRGGHFISTRANAEYDQVKFTIADRIALPGGAGGPLGLAFNDWLNPPQGGPYSNPWQIMQRLGIHTLKIDPAARAFADPAGSPMAQLLDGMLTLVNALRPGGFPVVQDGNLNTLRAGEGAIIIAYQPAPPYPLHNLLLGHTTRGWEIYNSNSHKLNPTVLPNCPQFNTPFVTDLLDSNGHAAGTETWHFLGVFIAA